MIVGFDARHDFSGRLVARLEEETLMIGNAVVLDAVHAGRCADFNSAISVNRDDLQASRRAQEVVVCWMRLGLGKI